jgi:hypothetical protein
VIRETPKMLCVSLKVNERCCFRVREFSTRRTCRRRRGVIVGESVSVAVGTIVGVALSGAEGVIVLLASHPVQLASGGRHIRVICWWCRGRGSHCMCPLPLQRELL